MTDDLDIAPPPRGPRMPDQRRDTPGAPPRGTASPLAGRVLPRGVAQVRPEAPAAVLMVDLSVRQVMYANEVAAQLAPGLTLPVSADEWAATADLRDLDGEALDETAHPLSRIVRFEPVAGQGVSAARSSALGVRREPLWVVALPLDEAPDLDGRALVVFLPVRDREVLQGRARSAHARTGEGPHDPGAPPSAAAAVADRDASAVREAAVLATGLSFTVADANADDLPLVWVNPAFTAVTGYTFDRAVGHNCRFLQGPGTDREVTSRMRAALEAGRSITETLLNFRADGTAFWNQVAMSPIVDADGLVTHYVGIQTDVSGRVAADAERDRALAAEQEARGSAEAAHDRLALLAEVTAQLSSTTDAQLACQRLARLVVPALGDFALLATVADDDPATVVAGPGETSGPAGGTTPGRSVRRGRLGLRDVAWHHQDAALTGALQAHAGNRLTDLNDAGQQALTSLLVGPGRLLGDVGQTGALLPAEQYLLPGPALDALRRLAPSSLATWALRSDGRTLGLLTVGTGGDRAPLSEQDQALGADIAARAGLALDRARLFRQQRDLASGMQQSLLQLSARAAPDHLCVAVRYLAAAEAAQVGGDFYDVFTQADGAGVVVIGDVMGHDTQAAAAMSQLRSIVRTLGMASDDSPSAVLKRTDHMMRASGVDTTATAAVVRLLPPQDGSARLEWSNAGHPPPLVVDVDGRVRLLQVPSSDLLLGVDPLTVRQLNRSHLPVGAVLLMYTDGLVERRTQPMSEGIDLLARAAAAAFAAADDGGEIDLDVMVEGVLQRMLPSPSADDVALVAVRVC